MEEFLTKGILGWVGMLLLATLTQGCIPQQANSTPLIQTPGYYASHNGRDVRIKGCETLTGRYQFGCANANSLKNMVADQRDLIEGQDMGPADGEAATLSIQRYRAGEVYELSDEVLISHFGDK